MKITFYGVRGSIATPGRNTVKYGGNTSCTHVQLNDGSHFVLDAGTGIRELGMRIATDQHPVHVLVTHNHWDHIQGFPFFNPVYMGNRCIHIASPTIDNMHYLPIMHTLGTPFHPVELDDIPSSIEPHILAAAAERYEFGNACVETKPLNHPNGGSAFKIEADGVKMAYVTDNELFPPEAPETTYAAWVEYVRGVDLLIHDAQYIESDMPCKHGWGHSLISQVLELACDAGVKAVALYHHDPSRTDAQLDEISIASTTMLKKLDKMPQFFCAAEGQCLTITPTSIETN